MQNFLNKVGKTAGAAVNKAGNKANELIEVNKTESQDKHREAGHRNVETGYWRLLLLSFQGWQDRR